MRIPNALISIALFLPSLSFGQIKVEDVGEGWKPLVDSAITLIMDNDMDKYNILINHCKSVEFIISDRSTTKTPDVIAISTGDLKLRSVNNIAAILVHESYHLYLFSIGVKMSEREEELSAYMYEYGFLCNLPNVEDWLFFNNINMIIRYQADRKR